MHFEQGFELQLVRFLGKCLALFLGQVSSDEQHGIGTHHLCLIELVLVHDEVLAQDGAGDSGTGDAHIPEVASEILLICEYGDGAGAILAVGSWNDIRHAFFLDPSFGGTLALELCNDA